MSNHTGQFDIIIPVGPRDLHFLEDQLKYTRRNIQNFRKIYLIPFMLLDFGDNDVIIIREDEFPFKIQDIASILGVSQRNGWYLQQLIKMYAHEAIPGLLDNFLVIDCDTFFLKPTNFIEGNKFLFGTGTEYHMPYFSHMKRLHPELVRVDPGLSGICHHMIFNQNCLDQLLNMVENYHNGKAFWRVFLEQAEPAHKELSGASEYEIYFNYMLKFHAEKVKIRPLKWTNVSVIDPEGDFDFISCHWHQRSLSNKI